ncbi:MAG: thioesterase family protein [Novosphingobium sp.]|nr:thioesterase family protein [Novosphingobium sp.]MCP5402385.1 thioesterase family protein [Novosphingobium sp.]
MGFSEILDAAAPDGDGFRVTIPEDWHQGRTAYGGFSSALAHSAALRTSRDLPPLRSAQVSFIAPLFGEVEAGARILRSGRNATWVSAEIVREGQVGLSASFVFMGPVESSLHLNDRPAPEALIAVDKAQPMEFREHSPVFLRHHFDVRFAIPRSGEKRPELCWWVRVRDREGLDPMTEILLIADSLPPGVLPLMHPGVPVSSMTWLCNLLTPTPSTRDGWWLLRSSGDYSEQGCSSQRMAIWNADGEPIASGMQSVALFG